MLMTGSYLYLSLSLLPPHLHAFVIVMGVCLLACVCVCADVCGSSVFIGHSNQQSRVCGTEN